MINVVVRVINVQLSALADNHKLEEIVEQDRVCFGRLFFYSDERRQNCMAIKIEERDRKGQQSDVEPN
jgi:hypothetical protein